jgi:serine/threonine protein kinase
VISVPEQVDIDSEPARRPDDEHNVAVKSGSETDPALVALIRQALDASPLPPYADEHRRGVGGESTRMNHISKFEVLGEIGRGGFGTVLLVRDPDLGRERALKVPNLETLDSPGALARFLGEARLAARIDHPNVVRVYEAETAGALPYIVMEYCPGGSLGRWLTARSKPDHLPQRWVAALVAEIAEGVHQAHLAGLIHRDIKPGNVLLERIGHEDEHDLPRFRPKIADFGLAKAFEQDGIGRSMTVSGSPVGTWAYMSPEQARGGKDILATTDVYATGAILYELLTGERLYGNLSQTELLGRLLDPAASPSPRALRNDLHRDLETICLKCLEKRPGDRYQNPSELTNDLRRFLAGLPILARPAPLWKRCLAQLKRHLVRSALTGLALTSVIAGTFAWSQFRDMKRQGEVEVLLNNLESATVAQFPELIPRIDPTDARVVNRLNSLFVVGTQRQKLAAALVLAKVRTDYRDYSYDQLLRAEPREIAPLTHCLRERILDLPSRLSIDANTASTPGTSESLAEAHDRRRAAAAAALLALDEGDRGWSLLRFSPNPQARSFLIHLLGPSGFDPRRIVDRLIIEPEISIRRALIQSLGELPDLVSDDRLRRRVISVLVDIYRHDSDSGVHGSAKWLMLHLGLETEINEIDRSLAGKVDRGSQCTWRISPHLLTLVTIDSPTLDRIIEVSDIEVTVDLFKKFRHDHPYVVEISRGGNSPMNSVNYCEAAQFCNWLSREEQIAEAEFCYRPEATERELWIPVEGHRDRYGFRLLTDQEFEVACRAGTKSTRYFGDSTSLLARYARYDQKNGMWASPVARYKPNDLGLFDMLGNAYETCQSTSRSATLKTQVAFCGGCWANDDIDITSSTLRGPSAINLRNQRGITDRFGFRVARTTQKRREMP